MLYYKGCIPDVLSKPIHAEGVSILKKMLHSGQAILGPKRCKYFILKCYEKTLPRNLVLGKLADADGGVGGLSSKEKNTQIQGIITNAIANPK